MSIARLDLYYYIEKLKWEFVSNNGTVVDQFTLGRWL
jgi:hypothetical protein